VILALLLAATCTVANITESYDFKLLMRPIHGTAYDAVTCFDWSAFDRSHYRSECKEDEPTCFAQYWYLRGNYSPASRLFIVTPVYRLGIDARDRKIVRAVLGDKEIEALYEWNNEQDGELQSRAEQSGNQDEEVMPSDGRVSEGFGPDQRSQLSNGVAARDWTSRQYGESYPQEIPPNAELLRDFKPGDVVIVRAACPQMDQPCWYVVEAAVSAKVIAELRAKGARFDWMVIK